MPVTFVGVKVALSDGVPVPVTVTVVWPDWKSVPAMVSANGADPSTAVGWLKPVIDGPVTVRLKVIVSWKPSSMAVMVIG